MWARLTGQQSTLTGPRPGLGGPGLGRIWAGLGLPRVGRWCCHVAYSDSKKWARAGDLGSRWSRADGLRVLNAVHGGPDPSPPLSSRLTVHRVHLAAPLLLLPCFLFPGRALTSGERPTSCSGASWAKLVGSRARHGPMELNRGVNGAG
jgi:hypothetical protein